MKKGQSISINTIIVAALGLAVLVVLFMIFTGRIGKFSEGVQSAQKCTDVCQAGGKGFQGAASADKQCPPGQSYASGAYSDGPNGCCCG